MNPEPELFRYTSGPPDADILLVGEAWGREEARTAKPFAGQAGKELDRMLAEAGLERARILCTNLVHQQPPDNDFRFFLYATKDKDGHQKQSLNGVYARPALVAGVAELHRLIARVKPKLIIACGNWPLWALAPDCVTVSTKEGFKLPGGISNWRGSQLQYKAPDNAHTCALLPVVHPTAILRAWDLRYITVHDLRRAARFSRDPSTWALAPSRGISFPDFQLAVDTLTGLLAELQAGPTPVVPDLETYARRHVVCIGLATPRHVICVPFFWFDDRGALIEHFDLEQEHQIWKLIRSILTHPNARVINQNILYDYQFLRRVHGINFRIHFDTMLAQNFLYPGTPKSLERLASLYCDRYVYWKDESQDWAGKGDPKQLFIYNCKDVEYTLEIYQTQQQLIARHPKPELWQDQLAQLEIAIDMMMRGVRYDHTHASTVRRELLDVATVLEHFLLEALPEDLRYSSSGKPWYNSPTHAAYIFYQVIGLAPVLHKKTKQPTLDASALETLRKRHPWLDPIFSRLEALRSVNVFLSHFLDIRFPPDRRLRCSFNVGGTETFRWSSSSTAFDEGTNLQNIPKGDE